MGSGGDSLARLPTTGTAGGHVRGRCSSRGPFLDSGGAGTNEGDRLEACLGLVSLRYLEGLPMTESNNPRRPLPPASRPGPLPPPVSRPDPLARTTPSDGLRAADVQAPPQVEGTPPPPRVDPYVGKTIDGRY